MEIISVRVIRPKDREARSLANVEITFDTGITLLDMHLLRPREEGEENYLRMPAITMPSGRLMNIYHPISKEVRAQMTEAANEALRQAVEAGVNDFTAIFEKVAEGEERAPEFSDIRIHWFDNDKPVRAFASLLMDGEIVLNRMAVVRDENTQMLTVRIPTHALPKRRWRIGYYKIYGAAYDQLYKQVLEAYANREPAEET